MSLVLVDTDELNNKQKENIESTGRPVHEPVTWTGAWTCDNDQPSLELGSKGQHIYYWPCPGSCHLPIAWVPEPVSTPPSLSTHASLMIHATSANLWSMSTLGSISTPCWLLLSLSFVPVSSSSIHLFLLLSCWRFHLTLKNYSFSPLNYTYLTMDFHTFSKLLRESQRAQ